jgi:DNA-binding transcriptional MerR regulator
MNINKVIKITGLTKKAIYYYENKGLISPEYNPESGYRIFTNDDVKILSVIAALRHIDVPIEKIKLALCDEISINELFEKHLIYLDRSIDSMKNIKLLITDFIHDNKATNIRDIKIEKIVDLRKSLELSQMERIDFIAKQFQRIFPGNLGKLYYLGLYNYLNESIDSDEKKGAWLHLVEDIDNLEIYEIPNEIEHFLSSEKFENWINQIQSKLNTSFKDVIELTEDEVYERVYENLKNQKKLNADDLEFMENFVKVQMFINSNNDFKSFLEKSQKNLEMLCSSYGIIKNRLFLIKKYVEENKTSAVAKEIKKIKGKYFKN